MKTIGDVIKAIEDEIAALTAVAEELRMVCSPSDHFVVVKKVAGKNKQRGKPRKNK